jgi:hypothetical protein
MQRIVMRSLGGCVAVSLESAADLSAWPKLVLPNGFETRFGEAERDIILAHERVHKRAGDPMINAVAAPATEKSSGTTTPRPRTNPCLDKTCSAA